ncbi:MAG: hypothetical protein FWC92_05875 [Defluviitaleaceae bacterium]|nr:hypothetical protein [Defluviitaleaceae bacterium]
MKIDFHTHSRLGKKLPFSPQYTEWHLQQAKLAGLDAICITEHYNGIEMESTFDYIQSHLKCVGDAFVANDGLIAFIGLEIDALEGGHFLVIGSMHDIKSIYKKLQPFLLKKQHPTYYQLVDVVKPLPILFGVSHPFRESNNIRHLTTEQLSFLEFLELNGKDMALDTNNENSVRKLAAETGLPILAGSDTHQAHQFGCICNHFNETITSIDELCHAINSNAYTIEHGQNTTVQVQTAKLIKTALKEVHKLGGDYVSVMFK